MSTWKETKARRKKKEAAAQRTANAAREEEAQRQADEARRVRLEAQDRHMEEQRRKWLLEEKNRKDALVADREAQGLCGKCGRAPEPGCCDTAAAQARLPTRPMRRPRSMLSLFMMTALAMGTMGGSIEPPPRNKS